MPIHQEKDRRTGRTHWVVEKYWPHRSGRFRRRVANKTIANDLWLKIQTAVANGTWLELRRQLDEPPPQLVTVAEFADVYLEEYCVEHQNDLGFKKHNLKPIKRILGHLPVKEVRRKHGHLFVKERGKDGVANGTINRGIAVLRNLLRFAIEKEHITMNPLKDFEELPEPKQKPRYMSPEEKCRLVDAIAREKDWVGLLSGLLGETGLRLDDGLRLQWPEIDLKQRLLSKRTSKSKTDVRIPLSDYAIEILAQLPRVVGSPYVFTEPGTRGSRKEAGARGALNRAREKVPGLEWVGFHDFRHFRATQWLIHGVDVRTVQKMLGHTDIQTTMVYVHYVESHAIKSVISAQKREQEAAAAEASANK